MEGICQSPMIPEWRLQMMANLIFRKYLSQKDKVLALANSILENYNGNTDEDRRNEAALEMKQRELNRLQKRMDNLIEMRADGDLSKDMFRMKSEELEPKMQKLQKEIEELSQKREPKVIEHYKEKLTILQYALSQYSCPKEGEDVPESVIEAYFSKIVVRKDGFDWYIRINGDPNKPLHCKLEGKRRSTTKVVVTQDFSPALDSSTTGCHQGLIANPITNPHRAIGGDFCQFLLTHYSNNGILRVGWLTKSSHFPVKRKDGYYGKHCNNCPRWST